MPKSSTQHMLIGAPGEATADTTYSDEINAKMAVPRHISAAGGAIMSDNDFAMRQPVDIDEQRDGHFYESMRVPDRIRVAGNASTFGGAQNDNLSMDAAFDQRQFATTQPIMLSTPPSTLTFRHTRFEENEHENARREVEAEEAWNTIDATPKETKVENSGPPSFPRSFGEALTPAQEMQLVRRQITRLCTQVYALEAQNESLRQNQYILYMAGGVFLAIQVLKHMFK